MHVGWGVVGFLLLGWLPASTALARCPGINSLPLGLEGSIGYDRDSKNLYYCDDVAWRKFGSGDAAVSASSADCASTAVGSGSGQSCCVGLECCITVNFPLASRYRRGSGTSLYAIPSTENLGGSISASVDVSRPATGVAVDAAAAVSAGLDVAVMQEANARGCGVAVKVCLPTLCTLGLCSGNYSLNASFPFRRNFWVAGSGGYNTEQVSDTTGNYTVRTSGSAELITRDTPTVSYANLLATPTGASTSITHLYALSDTMANVNIGNAANLVLESHMTSAAGEALNVRGAMTISRAAFLHPDCRR